MNQTIAQNSTNTTIAVPVLILTDTNMDTIDIAVYTALCSLIDVYAQCNVSYIDIAKIAKTTQKTAITHVKHLEDAGYIQVWRGKGYMNLYEVLK